MIYKPSTQKIYKEIDFYKVNKDEYLDELNVSPDKRKEVSKTYYRLSSSYRRIKFDIETGAIVEAELYTGEILKH